MTISPTDKRLLQIGCLTTFYAIYVPVFFPALHLTFFAPFLVSLFHRKPLTSCLWAAVACGLFIDVQSAERFGFTALNYTLVVWVLYSQRRHFFEDQLSTMALMTFCFSALSTLTAFAQRYFSEAPLIPTWAWVGTDLLLYPLVDSFYAIVGVVFPIMWWIRRAKRKPQRFSRSRPK